MRPAARAARAPAVVRAAILRRSSAAISCRMAWRMRPPKVRRRHRPRPRPRPLRKALPRVVIGGALPLTRRGGFRSEVIVNSTIKQPAGSRLCGAAVAAMATNMSLDYVVSNARGGAECCSRLTWMAEYLARKGMLMGTFISVPD